MLRRRTFKFNAAVRDHVIDLLKNRCFLQQESHFESFYVKVADDKQPCSGAFGKVYKVHSKENPSVIKAAKHINLNYECDYSDESVSTLSQTDTTSIEDFLTACQEATLLYQIFDHPNIVKCSDMWIEKTYCEEVYNSCNIVDIIEFVESGNDCIDKKTRIALQNTSGLSVYIIMDYYQMNLQEWINNCNDPQAHLSLVLDILSGLEYIHKLSYTHVDIKPENILINTEDHSVVIADFGLCIHGIEPIEGSIMERKGTLPYNTAPDEYYSPAFDLWSMGLLVYGLRNGLVTSAEYQNNLDSPSTYFLDRLKEKEEQPFIVKLVDALLQPHPDMRIAKTKLLGIDALNTPCLPLLSVRVMCIFEVLLKTQTN